MIPFHERFLKYYDRPFRFLPRFLNPYYAKRATNLYASALAAGDDRDSEGLKDLSVSRAIKTLRYAAKNVPFWRSYKDAAWQSLPIISKSDYKTDPESFLSRDQYFSSRKKFFSTSGSTGSPLNYFYEHHRYEIHHGGALYYALRNLRAPIQDRTVLTTFRAAFSGSFAPFRVIYEDLDSVDMMPAQEFLSSEKMRFSDFVAKLSAVDEVRRPILIMRPSQAFLLAHWLSDNNKILHLPFILLVGENLFEDQRKFIENIFHCPVRMIYSSRELSIMGYECPSRLGFIHLLPESYFTEILDDGDLVITSFVNLTMPFIRYRIGDRAEIKMATGKCQCGVWRPLIKILGRDNHLIKLADKSVSYSALEAYLYNNRADKIKQMQCIQEAPDSFKIRLCKSASFSEIDEQNMSAVFKTALGSNIKVRFEYPDFIESSESGKFITFKSII